MLPRPERREASLAPERAPSCSSLAGDAHLGDVNVKKTGGQDRPRLSAFAAKVLALSVRSDRALALFAHALPRDALSAILVLTRPCRHDCL